MEFALHGNGDALISTVGEIFTTTVLALIVARVTHPASVAASMMNISLMASID